MGAGLADLDVERREGSDKRVRAVGEEAVEQILAEASLVQCCVGWVDSV